VFGGFYKLTAEDYSVLTTLAKKGHSRILESTKLLTKVNALEKKNSTFSERNEKLFNDNWRLSKENTSLKKDAIRLQRSFEKIEKAIQKLGLVDEVNKELKSMTPTKQRSYGMER